MATSFLEATQLLKKVYPGGTSSKSLEGLPRKTAFIEGPKRLKKGRHRKRKTPPNDRCRIYNQEQHLACDEFWPIAGKKTWLSGLERGRGSGQSRGKSRCKYERRSSGSKSLRRGRRFFCEGPRPRSDPQRKAGQGNRHATGSDGCRRSRGNVTPEITGSYRQRVVFVRTDGRLCQKKLRGHYYGRRNVFATSYSTMSNHTRGDEVAHPEMRSYRGKTYLAEGSPMGARKVIIRWLQKKRKPNCGVRKKKGLHFPRTNRFGGGGFPKQSCDGRASSSSSIRKMATTTGSKGGDYILIPAKIHRRQ